MVFVAGTIGCGRRAHGEVFGEIRSAMAMVEVSSLIDPEMLVEIDADAVIADQLALTPAKSRKTPVPATMTTTTGKVVQEAHRL